jgi:hypothetical protein
MKADELDAVVEMEGEAEGEGERCVGKEFHHGWMGDRLVPFTLRCQELLFTTTHNASLLSVPSFGGGRF